VDKPETQRLVAELNRQHVLEIDELRQGLQVTSLSHVGRVQLDDLTITVQPKIAPNELLSLVRYAFGLRDLRLFAVAEYQTAGSLFQDLLAAQLLAEAREIIEAGIARRYVEVRSDLSTPRGRIDFGALAARPNWDRAALPCLDHPRSTDHLLNQTLRAGVDLAADVAQDGTLVRSLKRTAAVLAELANRIPLTTAVLASADRAITRLTTPYEPALRLIELLHSSSWISLDGERSTRLPGFLFDMNRFFQALVGRFLGDHLDSLRVVEERSLTGFMRYLPQHNPRGRKAPLPRPDFTIGEDGEVVTFLDAKYRDLWERDLPSGMLYQLGVYALSHGSVGNAAIIYPSCSDSAREAVIEIADMVQGVPRAHVALRPLELSVIAKVIADRDLERGKRIALSLVYGSARKSVMAA
jgi:5-methylcytosine-specific restriction enzyme subunit McrC